MLDGPPTTAAGRARSDGDVIGHALDPRSVIRIAPRPAAPPVPGDAAASIEGQALLDSLPDRVALLDERGIVVAANAGWRAGGPAWARGMSAGIGDNYLHGCARLARDGVTTADEVLEGLLGLISGDRSELLVEDPCDGSDARRYVLQAARYAGTGPRRVVVQHREVTIQRAAEAEARFRSGLLDAVTAAVVALDLDGRIIAWNAGAERLYGWTAAEVIGCDAKELLVEDGVARLTGIDGILAREGRWTGERIVRRRDGSIFPASVHAATRLDAQGEVVGFVAVSVDITAERRARQELHAAHDYMRAVADSMGEGLVTVDEAGAIVYLNPRAEALLGWSSDELVGLTAHEVLHHTRADGSPYPADECPFVAACRAGTDARAEADSLVRRDGTLLPVRQVMTAFQTEHGIAGFALLFTDMTEQRERERESQRKLLDLEWIERIRRALDEDGLVLQAQPIVELGTGTVVQHELLLRMRDDDGSLIPPGRFLPVAEAYGLIGEIDRWVIRESMALAATGRPVELNLSAHSLSDPSLYDFVDAELERSGAPPASLVFELTETALMYDEEAAMAFVAAIARRGCGFALDDFGTGYGGFSYLKRLPVDFLKIDIEFVRDLVVEPASRQVVEAVVSLARGFDVRTIAEGVEDAETLALLRELGVDHAQGFHTGRPASLEQMATTPAPEAT